MKKKKQDASLDDFEVFLWNKNFETGVEIIDEQHKNLVSLLNKLTVTLIYDDSFEVARVFEEMAAYAEYHFKTEEAIWAPCFKDDAWLTSHQEIHSSFIPSVLKLKEEQGDMPLRETMEHILKFLIHWLVYHIVDSDKRMAIVLENMQAGASLEEAKNISDEEMYNSAQVLIDTVLIMYDEISSRTLSLMRERLKRKAAEEALIQANRELEKRAITDQLTGLFNRRHFDEVFALELRKNRRNKRNLTLIMLDIDFFKKLNDQYGHAQGDSALEKLGQLLKELCRRPGDIAFRIGGEEFAIVISEQSPSSSHGFAERIRGKVEALKIPSVNNDAMIRIRVSVGVITKVPELTDSVKTYMNEADARLYRAKGQGRNQIVSSSAELE
jgi:diguanylate cyclase (GGDEF)-like protein/hemerythrin-like metal-binding protein